VPRGDEGKGRQERGGRQDGCGPPLPPWPEEGSRQVLSALASYGIARESLMRRTRRRSEKEGRRKKHTPLTFFLFYLSNPAPAGLDAAKEKREE